MLFVVMGFLKADSGPIPQAVQQQSIDYLGQPIIDIRAFGALRDEAGERAGMMLMLDVDDFAAAERFAHDSPFRQADLYEEVRIFEFAVQAGSI